MGQTQGIEEGTPPITPPEVEVNRRRQDYLHRLGIKKDQESYAAFHPPTKAAAEAPDRLEHRKAITEAGEGDFEMNTLDLQSQDDFRVTYLRKLAYSNVWVPKAQKSPQHQTVIIFDWDDTLLCTSFLNLRNQESMLSPTIERNLRDIEAASKKLLELAKRMGQTFIITNAMSGWVEYSAAKWAPNLLDTLQRVRVISARTKFEPEFPGEVSKWKESAFLEVQKQLDNEIITNLISVGDSNFEMDALHVMGKQFAQALVKTIKFRENPSPEELLKQLELVTQKFEKIVENEVRTWIQRWEEFIFMWVLTSGLAQIGWELPFVLWKVRYLQPIKSDKFLQPDELWAWPFWMYASGDTRYMRQHSSSHATETMLVLSGPFELWAVWALKRRMHYKTAMLISALTHWGFFWANTSVIYIAEIYDNYENVADGPWVGYWVKWAGLNLQWSVLSPICTFAALWLLCGKVREEAIKSLKKE
ncbi:unnamed protein product [Durusdinium trenchii]|uniref:Uncharacterized protein n=1 Tax=Durusdinium trenchii TaxID=1381693 RepID=A0ABP0PVZ6_9DINO